MSLFTPARGCSSDGSGNAAVPRNEGTSCDVVVVESSNACRCVVVESDFRPLIASQMAMAEIEYRIHTQNGKNKRKEELKDLQKRTR